MKGNRSEMNLDELRNQYSLELEKLETLLLSGTAWNQVEKLRKDISNLSLEIYNKLYSNPAESKLRNQ
jgi:hypothetical protein